MRADRLLSILLILQRQGRATAQQLAADLEVSERTIYRDIDALGMAGVPVYGEPGPEGGYTLLDNFRTFLTGLTDQEMQALFMLSIPQPLSELGASQSLKSAMLKIFASLPSGGQENEEWVRQRFLLDTTPWPGRNEASHRLQTIQQAVWQDQLLTLCYRVGPLAHDVEQVVSPYSLVAKAGAWYLVYAINGRPRVMRVAALTRVRALDDTFERPEEFSLGIFWRKWCGIQEGERATFRVTVRAASDSLASVDAWKIADQPPRLVDEEQTLGVLSLAFESLEDARSKLLGLGRSVEVLEPAALRKSVADYAQQTLSLYQVDNDIGEKQ